MTAERCTDLDRDDEEKIRDGQIAVAVRDALGQFLNEVEEDTINSFVAEYRGAAQMRDPICMVAELSALRAVREEIERRIDIGNRSKLKVIK